MTQACREIVVEKHWLIRQRTVLTKLHELNEDRWKSFKVR